MHVGTEPCPGPPGPSVLQTSPWPCPGPPPPAPTQANLHGDLVGGQDRYAEASGLHRQCKVGSHAKDGAGDHGSCHLHRGEGAGFVQSAARPEGHVPIAAWQCRRRAGSQAPHASDRASQWQSNPPVACLAKVRQLRGRRQALHVRPRRKGRVSAQQGGPCPMARPHLRRRVPLDIMERVAARPPCSLAHAPPIAGVGRGQRPGPAV